MSESATSSSYSGPQVKYLLHKIWSFNISMPGHKGMYILLIILGLIGWAIWQPQILNIEDVFNVENVEVFYMVNGISGELLAPDLYFYLTAIAVAKVVWGVLIGLADLMLFKRVTNRQFDYANMINMVIVNCSILFLGIFSYSYIPFSTLLTSYDALISAVPTLFKLNGVLAFIIALLIGDFCFYWAHRMIHNVRLFWNLGHIYHHRNENLSQLTHGVEPRFFLLNAQGISSLLLLPVLAKLFTNDFSDAGYFLIPMALINLWIDPSHSVALYALENRYRPFKLLRFVFMTTCVHYTHHSRDPIHNKRTGCNFGARTTLWDRLFGTYVEPADYIPESGLFSKHTDYCVNPIRFLLLPYVRFADELRQNSIKHWPKILFGSVFWSPPKKSKLSH